MRCSEASDACNEPASGTTAEATCVLALEQPGPWGRKAAAESRLDPDLGAALDRALSGAGGRFSLLRRPSHKANDEAAPDAARRAAYVGWCGSTSAGEAWLLRLTVEDPEALRRLDWEALSRGDRTQLRESAVAAGLPAEDAGPTLLVCTNGKRDVCCSLRGRPVALAGVAEHPGRVWEVSHTGGHRFAPTGTLLPWGLGLASLTSELASALLRDAKQGRVPHAALAERVLRGRSGLPRAGQAAEDWVRREHGIRELGDLTTTPGGTSAGAPEAASPWLVRHVDGREWRLHVAQVDGPSRPDSCGKDAVTARLWQVEPA